MYQECICHYWYFLDKVLKFQTYVYNRCHAASMMSMKPNNIATLNTGSVDYQCIINGFSQTKAISLLKKC